jgi:DNA primase
VSNALKQEIFIKEISTKFELSEQSLFNELGVQKQIVQQHKPSERKETNVVKLEKVQEILENINPLLVLEEKLVELMLKYGDYVLDRKTPENEAYQITVIEEIINHLEEDQCEIISPINQKIIEEIKLGIAQSELRSGNFFMTLMDENIVSKTADALVNPYELSNWEKHNIYFSKEEELVDRIVKDVVIRYKREYIIKIINDLKHQISEENSEDAYRKIINLTQLKNKIDEKLYRIL